MANFFYTRAARDIMLGDVHFDTDDIRVMLVMTNTTADTQEDAATISAFTTLDEHDGSGYPATFATRKALSGETVTEDTTNDRGVFDDTGNVTFSSLGAGTRAIQAAIVYKHGTSDVDSVPLIYIDTPAFPNSNGGDYTITWHADGVGYAQA